MAIKFTYSNSGTWTNNTNAINSTAESITALDINQDGLKDLFIAPTYFNANPDLPARAFINQGNMTFAEDNTVFTNGQPVTGYLNHPQLVADFNNDGINDLMLVDQGQEVTMPWEEDTIKLLLGTSDGRLKDVSDTNLPNTLNFNHNGDVADIDNDGDQDVLITTLDWPNSYLLINDGTGNFTMNTSKLPDNMTTWTGEGNWMQPGGSGFGDINGDGRVDIVFGSYKDAVGKKITVATQDANGNFIETQGIQFKSDVSGAGISTVRSADLDGDGDVDFLAKFEGGSSSENGIMALRNDAGTLVDATSSWFPNGNTWNVMLPDHGDGMFGGLDDYGAGFELRDFNNDGLVDVSFAHYKMQLANPGSYLYINNGNGFTQATYANGVSNNIGWDYASGMPAFADFDNDGDIDVALFRRQSDTTFTIDTLESGFIEKYSSSADTVTGTGYRDHIIALDGNDNVSALAGNDLVYGNKGNDNLYGNQGEDVVFGGQGVDMLFGGQGQDQVYGNKEDDVIYGNKQNDDLFGGQGTDNMFGGQGEDNLYGNKGDDFLYGNRGYDVINGGLGNDLLHGGGHADKFVFSAGTDIVLDFDFSEGDRITGIGFSSAYTTQGDRGALISNDVNSMELIGVNYTDITSDYFV